MTDNKNVLNISYPESYPGSQTTKISFHKESPNLTELFSPGKIQANRRCFVTDATVATLPDVQDFISQFEDGVCGNDLLLILGSGEPYKTIESVLEIVKTAVEANFSRKDIFVGIGGGVICDMTGFAASLYKRGIACQFVPTTLLAMVDASIGGKTGCDFENYKNMIGAFWPAQEIHIYPEFVQSLSQAQYRSGLGEAIKTGLLYDKELYQMFKTESEKILSRDKELIFNLIEKCAVAKAKVVEQDFTEKNIRMYLNLGHTFGHALETLAGLGNIPHGDAVAWGIARQVVLCAREDICSESFKDEVLEVLKQYGWCTEATHPLITGGGIGERLLNIMKKDKKNASSKIKLVLQRALNDTFTEEIEDSKILSVLK
ncbi:MAG: 3-dehydroquinate synthase [Treponema sp.]|nr:3-dehydroquinate synthase [Treponema sp.]